MSHIDIKSYAKQTIGVITDSESQENTLELYATRLLNELMSRRMAAERAIQLVAEYKELIREHLNHSA